MQRKQFQFTLPQAFAATLWLALVFTSAHYLRSARVDGFVLFGGVYSVAHISLAGIVLAYLYFYHPGGVRLAGDALQTRTVADDVSFRAWKADFGAWRDDCQNWAERWLSSAHAAAVASPPDLDCVCLKQFNPEHAALLGKLESLLEVLAKLRHESETFEHCHSR